MRCTRCKVCDTACCVPLQVNGQKHCLGMDVLDQRATLMARFVAPVTMLATGGCGQVSFRDFCRTSAKLLSWQLTTFRNCNMCTLLARAIARPPCWPPSIKVAC